MSDWNRRSVLATGAAFTTGGLLASAGVTGAESDEATDGLEEPGGWSSHRGGPGKAGYVPADGEFEKPDTVAWEYEEDGPLAVVDGTVYLNTGEEIHALDDDDGSVEWTAAVDDTDAMTTPAVAGNGVYVGGDQLTALNADSGEVEWTVERGASSPIVAHGTVLAIDEGTLYALEPDSGEVVWERETVEMETDDESDPQEHTVSAVVASDHFVHARTANENGEDENGLVAFDPETGETVWTWLPTVDSDSQFPTFGGLMANDGRIYAVRDASGGGTGGPILDAETGEQTGEGRTELEPAVGDEAWISTLDYRFTASDHSGEELWRVSGGTMQWGPASIVGETVVAIKAGRPPSEGTELVGFDIETGDEKWTVEMDFDSRDTGSRAPTLTEETVYVRSEPDDSSDNVLVALRPSGADDSDDDDDDDDDSGEDGSDDDSDEGDSDEDGSDDDSETDGSDGDSETDDSDGDSGEDGSSGDESDDDQDEDDSEETDSDEPEDDESDESDDDSGESDGPEDGTGDDETDDDGTDDHETDDPDDSDDETSDSDDDDSGGTDDDSDENGDDDDSVPGFTAGAGLVGSALGLEWLRRQADSEEPAE